MANKKRPRIAAPASQKIKKKQKKTLLDFIVDNRKLLGGALIILCLVVAITLAIISNRAPADETRGDTSASVNLTDASDKMVLSIDEPVNNLVKSFFNARTAGDLATIETLTRGITDEVRLYYQEMAQYVERYSIRNIYSKSGPEASSYIIYVDGTVKFFDSETPLPSMETLLVRAAEDGSVFIDLAELSQEDKSYIDSCNLKDDGVIDLNNRIKAEYNQLIENDAELATLMSDMEKNLKAAVSKALAARQNASAAESSDTQAPEDEGGEVMLKATGVVNVRLEPSTDSEKVGQTVAGATYKVLSTEGEWSQIEYNGAAAYVMTEFFEKVTGGEADEQTTAGAVTPGTYTMNTTCNIRKEANTDCDVLGSALQGSSVEVLEMAGDEWCKIKTGNITGYIMIEFLNR